MVEKEKYEGEETFYCECCGRHYREKDVAQECEKNCTLHNKCHKKVAEKSIEG